MPLPACRLLPPWPRRFRHRLTSLPPSAQAPRPCYAVACRRAASGATGAWCRGRGPSTSPASRAASPRADACAGLQQAMRATPRALMRLGQINLGYHKHRFTGACDLLDPYRNLAVAAEILKEQHTPGEDWLLAIGRYHRPAGGEPAAAIGAACRATLPAWARDQPPRSARRARKTPHDETPSRPSRVHGPTHAAVRPAAGLACRRATDRCRGPWRHVGIAVLRSPESPAARQRTGAAVHPDAPGSCHTGGRSRDAAGAQRQAHARHRRATGDRSARPAAVRGHRRRRASGLVAAPRRRFARTWRGRPGRQRRDRAGPGAAARAPWCRACRSRPWPATTWPIAWACGTRR